MIVFTYLGIAAAFVLASVVGSYVFAYLAGRIFMRDTGMAELAVFSWIFMGSLILCAVAGLIGLGYMIGAS